MYIQPPDNREKEALEKFRANVSDLDLDELTLLRFLRARDCDLTRCEDMLRKSLKWRQEMNIESFLHYEAPPPLKEDFIYELCGVSYSGIPVIWCPLGIWNARTMIENGYTADICNFRFHLFEVIMRRMRECNQSNMILLLALKELSYSKIDLKTLSLLRSSLQILERNYPEVLKCAIVINAPWIFSFAFNFCSPIFSKRTLDKIQVYDSDKTKWLPALLEMMPPESLPTRYKEKDSQLITSLTDLNANKEVNV